MSSVSGLSVRHQAEARAMAVAAARLSLHHAAATHYTMTSARWEGISRGFKAWRGEFPKFGDCSSTSTWWLWNGLDHFHCRDTVNGLRWQAGFTGTMLRHGRAVHLGHLLPGDLVIYGTGWPGEHVAMYVGGGMVISHGSEAGPFLLPVRYRPDILACRRCI